MLETHTLINVLLGFCAFSLAGSVVYVINDIFDAEADRSHDTKKHRPIASGAISMKSAWAIACVLLVAAVILNAAFRGSLLSWILLSVYVTANLAYSAKLYISIE